jgi:virginiamycin A acetyltransferase
VSATARETAKGLAHGLATIAVMPALLSYAIRSRIIGRDRALEGSSQALSLVPGLVGQYVRRAFLAQVLAGGCARSAAIEFGVLFSQAGARIEAGVYIGPRCHLGHVHLEANVLLAAGVHIPSGAHTHGTDVSSAIRDQPGRLRMVRVGAGSWIGSNAVVLADIGRDTVVGAGAVVTRPLPDGVIAAGVPARVIRRRAEVEASQA